MINEQIARLRAHQRNIDRYQGLLRTKLTDLELQFLHKRLREEQLAMLRLIPPTPIKTQEASNRSVG